MVEYKDKDLYTDGGDRSSHNVKHVHNGTIPRRGQLGPLRVPKGCLFMMGTTKTNVSGQQVYQFLPTQTPSREGGTPSTSPGTSGSKLPRFKRFFRLIH